MARNRQRAKERQAARRAARQAGRGDGPARETDGAPAPAPEFAEDPALAAPSGQSEEAADLAVGAPPEDLGHSEAVLDPVEVAVDEDELDEAEDGASTAVRGPRGVRGGRAVEADAAREREGSRVVAFLRAVAAELRRVQWPDRRALTTLTGVVLGFVLLAGGYLGLLDAIFSRIMQAIL